MKINSSLLFSWIYRICNYDRLFVVFNFRCLSVLYTNVHNQSIYEHRAMAAYWTCVQSDFNAFHRRGHCIVFLYILCGILLYVSLDCIVHVCVCIKKTWTNLFSLLQKLTPWVGLRKINVSYWGWEDMSPFTASTLQWLPGEPSDSGFCAYLERAEVAGLKAKPCTANTEGLICEKPVGEKSVRCITFFFFTFPL